MRLVVRVSGQCIEKAVKRRYESLVVELIEREDPEKERELEFLLEFIKKADFAELRRRGFDGSREAVVEIRKEGERFVVEEL